MNYNRDHDMIWNGTDHRDHFPLQGTTYEFIQQVIRRVRTEYVRYIGYDEGCITRESEYFGSSVRKELTAMPYANSTFTSRSREPQNHVLSGAHKF